MNTLHWLLLVLWVLYAVLHSFLADDMVKQSIQKITGNRFRYYRLCYSLFALVTLILLLLYQFSIPGVWLYSSLVIRVGLSVLFIIPGLIIMIMCIRKYFYELSGIQALKKDRPPVTAVLQQSGLHNYIRHPLYAGTLLFVWGLLILIPLLSNLIAAAVITIYVLIGIQFEERKLVMEYGDEYIEYSGRVPKLIPKF